MFQNKHVASTVYSIRTQEPPGPLFEKVEKIRSSFLDYVVVEHSEDDFLKKILWRQSPRCGY
jgi:hypothetical protein